MATAATEETTAEPAEQTAGDGDASGQPPGGGLNKVKIIALLVGLIVVMSGIGYIFLPGPTETTEANATDIAEDTAAADDSTEVPIGTFNTTNTKAIVGASVQVKCQLVAHVRNAEDFKAKKDANEARIRDSINVVIRSASGEDLNDPALDTLKRLIREEINKIVGSSFVTHISIPDWQAMDR